MIVPFAPGQLLIINRELIQCIVLLLKPSLYYFNIFVVTIFCFLISPPDPLPCRAAHGVNGSLHLPPVYALDFITHMGLALP